MQSMTKFLFALCLALFVHIAKSSVDEGISAARILLYKSTKTQPVVQGKDFVVDYKVINNGDATASQIKIIDRYDQSSFEMIHNADEAGNVQMIIDELPAGAVTSFNVTVRPKLYGVYDSSRARLSYDSGYRSESNEDDMRSGSSSSLGRVRILSAEEYLRTTSYYYREWAVFYLGFAFAVLLPFWKWWSHRLPSKSTSSDSSKSKKKSH